LDPESWSTRPRMSIISCVSSCVECDVKAEGGWSAWSPLGRSPNPPGPSNAMGNESVAVNAFD
jgi:hypothetical protein